MSNELIVLGQWEKAKQAIAACTTIDELKSIRDKAEALKAYAKQARESLEVQNNVAEIKIRCEKRIGEFSKQLPKETKWSSSHDGKLNILKQAGIKHHERYEAIANLPEAEFEEHIKKVKESNEELTTAGIIKMARENDKQIKRKIEAELGKQISLDSSIDLRLGDFKKVLKDVKSVDLILTDPPYPAEYLPLWEDLAIFAKEKLKDNGYLIAYSGQLHLPEVIEKLKKHLDYVWTFCLYHEGQTQIVNGVNVICRWKPIFIFQKKKTKFKNTIQDYVISESREKGQHDWQQGLSAVKKLTEIFSKPNDLVCDPFSGGGTVALACKEMNRKFVGAEIDEKTYNISKNRI